MDKFLIPALVDGRKTALYIRLNNGTKAIDDEAEIEKYIAQRWGTGPKPSPPTGNGRSRREWVEQGQRP